MKLFIKKMSNETVIFTCFMAFILFTKYIVSTQYPVSSIGQFFAFSHLFFDVWNIREVLLLAAFIAPYMLIQYFTGKDILSRYYEAGTVYLLRYCSRKKYLNTILIDLFAKLLLYGTITAALTFLIGWMFYPAGDILIFISCCIHLFAQYIFISLLCNILTITVRNFYLSFTLITTSALLVMLGIAWSGLLHDTLRVDNNGFWYAANAGSFYLTIGFCLASVGIILALKNHQHHDYL